MVGQIAHTYYTIRKTHRPLNVLACFSKCWTKFIQLRGLLCSISKNSKQRGQCVHSFSLDWGHSSYSYPLLSPSTLFLVIHYHLVALILLCNLSSTTYTYPSLLSPLIFYHSSRWPYGSPVVGLYHKRPSILKIEMGLGMSTKKG
jgi:hypothetical protein